MPPASWFADEDPYFGEVYDNEVMYIYMCIGNRLRCFSSLHAPFSCNEHQHHGNIKDAEDDEIARRLFTRTSYANDDGLVVWVELLGDATTARYIFATRIFKMIRNAQIANCGI